MNWPDWLVIAVQDLKRFFEWFSIHAWCGIPLDLWVRFLFLAGLYWVIRRRFSLKIALLVCLSLLFGKEIFDMFAVRSLHKVHLPEFLDLEDVTSGLLGIGIAEMGYRLFGGSRDPFKSGIETVEEQET